MIHKLESLKAEWAKEKDVLFSALFLGMLAHLYMMTNKLPNIDDYISMFHYGAGYTSGRWLLALCGNFMFRIDGNYSLPLFNGFLFVLLLSLSITIFLKPFHDQNRWIKRIFAGLFVAFPTVTATMGFMFTVPFYGLAVLFMAIAFYLLITYKYGFLFSTILVCCSLGIYQAYWGLIAGFLLLYLISKCCIKECENKDIIILALKSFVTLLLGVLFYLLINTIMLKWQNVSMSGYQGLDQMSHFSLGRIPEIIKTAYGLFFGFVTDNYMYITCYAIIRVVIAIGYFIVVGFCIFLIIKERKDILKNLMLVLFTVLLPLAINSIYLLSNDTSSVHTLMCYSVVLVFWMPFVYLNGLKELLPWENVFGLIKYMYLVGVAVVTVLYVRFANIYYLNLELSFHETYSFMETLSTRMQMEEGYALDKPVYFYGMYKNGVNKNIWETRMVNQMIGNVDVTNVINSPMIRQNYFRVYLGQSIGEVYELSQAANHLSLIEKMPSYPDDGSIVITEEMIIVKLSDE